MPDFNLKLPNFTAEMSWSCRIKFSMVDDTDDEDDDIPLQTKIIFFSSETKGRTANDLPQPICL